MTKHQSLLRRAPPVTAHTLAKIEECFGGRALLIDILLHAPRSRELDALLGVLADPESDHTSLSTLLTTQRFHPSDFYAALSVGQRAKAQLFALRHVADQVPAVADDIMRRALPHDGVCPDCHGKGQVLILEKPGKGHKKHQPLPDGATGIKCRTCWGTGQIGRDPDGQAVDQALELAGLAQKSGLTITQQSIHQTAVLNPGGSVSDLIRFTDEALYGQDRPLVVDLTPDPEAP